MTITQKESKVINEQEFEGHGNVFISTDCVQRRCHSYVLCKVRGVGKGKPE
jgi:hypothetical protein